MATILRQGEAEVVEPIAPGRVEEPWEAPLKRKRRAMERRLAARALKCKAEAEYAEAVQEVLEHAAELGAHCAAEVLDALKWLLRHPTLRAATGQFRETVAGAVDRARQRPVAPPKSTKRRRRAAGQPKPAPGHRYTSDLAIRGAWMLGELSQADMAWMLSGSKLYPAGDYQDIVKLISLP